MNDKLGPSSAIITINSDGIIQSVGRTCYSMFGYELEEMMGENITKIIPPPYKEQHQQYLKNYLRTGCAKIIGKSRILEAQHKDGTIFTIRLSVSEIQMGSQPTFVGLVEKIGDTATTITVDVKGTIISCNQNCKNLFGYTPDALANSSFMSLFVTHSQTKEEFFNSSKNVIRNVAGLHQNGTVFPVSLQITVVKVGTIELYTARIEGVGDKEAVFSIDSEGIIQSCNHNFVSPLFGYHHSELLGISVENLIPNVFKRIVTDWSYDTGIKKLKIDHSSSHSHNHESENRKIRSILLKRVQVKHKDGSFFPVDLEIEEFFHEGNLMYSIKLRRTQTASECSGSSVIEGSGLGTSSRIGSSSGNGTSSGSSGGTPGSGYYQGYYDRERTPSDTESDGSLLKSKTQTSSLLGAMTLVSKESPSNSTVSKSPSSPSNPSVCPHEATTKSHFTPPPSTYSGNRYEDEYGDDHHYHRQGGVGVFRDRSDYGGENVQDSREEREFVTGEQELQKYRIGPKLGSGSFGVVKLATHIETQEEYAIKVLHKDRLDAPQLSRTRREIQIMEQLCHPNLTKCHKVIETNEEIYIVMDFFSGGELHKKILARNGIPENEAKGLFSQILSAVSYCHQKHIIHRDLKHKNILLDKNGAIKIIDFGLSNFAVDGEFRSTFCGTPAYAAPEMILGTKYAGPEVDVWSLGVVLFSMLSSQFPFATVVDIVNGVFKPLTKVSSECNDLLSGLLQTKVENRLSIRQVRSHSWIKTSLVEYEQSVSHLIDDPFRD